MVIPLHTPLLISPRRQLQARDMDHESKRLRSDVFNVSLLRSVTLSTMANAMSEREAPDGDAKTSSI